MSAAGVDVENGVNKRIFGFEEAIHKTGLGKFHWLLQLLCGTCLMASIIETLNTGYVLPSAQCDLQLTTQDKGFLNAVCYVGMIAGSYVWGFLADTKGRRFVLVLTLVADAVCTFLDALSHTLWLLLLLRFLNGFFICGSGSVVFAYLGEFHSEGTRARAIVWLGVFVALGTMILPGLAWLVIPQTSWTFQLPWITFNSWRYFLILGSVPGLLAALGIYTFLPESPKYLLAVGRKEEALKALQKIFSMNSGQKPDLFPVLELELDIPVAKSKHESSNTNANTVKLKVFEFVKVMWHQTAPLFRKQHFKNMALTCAIDFAIFACSNGFLLWFPELFSRMSTYMKHHPDVNTTLTVCQSVAAITPDPDQYFEPWILSAEGNTPVKCSNHMENEVFQNNLAIGGTTVVAYLLAGYLVPIVGKRNILIISMLISGSCGISLHWVGSPAYVLTLSCFFMALSTMCVSVVNSIVVDIFPTQLRGMAVCLALMFGRIGTCLGSLLIGSILEVSCSSAFFALSGVIIGCGFLSLALPARTKLIPISEDAT